MNESMNDEWIDEWVDKDKIWVALTYMPSQKEIYFSKEALIKCRILYSWTRALWLISVEIKNIILTYVETICLKTV